MGVGLFGDSALPELGVDMVSFRALSSLGARKAKRVVAAARFGLAFSNWLDSRFHAPSADVPDLDSLASPRGGRDVSPEEAAMLLRAAWGLRDAPVSNVLGLLERQGVRVFSIDSHDREVDAFSFWAQARPYVFLNPDKSGERLRFDLAHELAHLVLHKELTTNRAKHFEYEANEFASAFLMPAGGVLGQVATAARELRMSDVMTMKRSWRVSAVAMVRRLHFLGVINEWTYRNWMVELSSKGFRRGEPDGMHREQSRLLASVLSENRGSGGAIRKISSESKVPEGELEGLIVGLAVVPLSSHAGQTRRSEGGLSSPDLLRLHT